MQLKINWIFMRKVFQFETKRSLIYIQQNLMLMQ